MPCMALFEVLSACSKNLPCTLSVKEIVPSSADGGFFLIGQSVACQLLLGTSLYPTDDSHCVRDGVVERQFFFFLSFLILLTSSFSPFHTRDLFIPLLGPLRQL